RRFAADCEASHVSLFRRDQGAGAVEEDLERHLLAQDLIYVGGGNMVSMLGAWRAHGLDQTLRRAWRAGVVLCGPSAGSLCWFEQALSAFHGAPRVAAGLGLLPYSNCVHYDAEPARRAEYHRAVEQGMLRGYAADDGVGLHFHGTRLHRVVSSRLGAAAYRVDRKRGAVRESRLEPDHLGELAPGSRARSERETESHACSEQAGSGHDPEGGAPPGAAGGAKRRARRLEPAEALL